MLRKWTREGILSEIRRRGYSTIKDLKLGSQGAYNAALRLGILDELPLERSRLPNGWWTEERILLEISERGISTLKEFRRRCKKAYDAAKSSGLVGKLPLVRKCVPRWTDKDAIRKSREFSSRSEFKEGCVSAYNYLRRRGLLGKCTWLKPKGNVYRKHVDNIYAYFFDGPDRNGRKMRHVYVGRTISPRERDVSHRNRPEDTVFRFAKRRRVPVPEMTILEEKLRITGRNGGQERERFHLERLRDEGWKILNRAKTGSLGRMGKKWSMSRIKSTIEDSGYKTISEFAKGSPSAYVTTLRKGIDPESLGLKRTVRKSGFWTKENILKEIKERKYRTRGEFQKGSPSAYNKARSLGIMDELPLEKPKERISWTKEKFMDAASRCRTRSELLRKFPTAYHFLRKNNLLDLCPTLEKSMTERPVLQYTMDMKLVGRHRSLREAALSIGKNDNSGICQAARGKIRTAYGFVWRYAD